MLKPSRRSAILISHSLAAGVVVFIVYIMQSHIVSIADPTVDDQSPLGQAEAVSDGSNLSQARTAVMVLITMYGATPRPKTCIFDCFCWCLQ